MTRVVWLALAFALAGGPAGCSEKGSEELLVGAAMSLRDAMTELGQRFERAHPGVRVRFHFASTGTIATQIIEGAPVDVFAAASTDHMERLIRAGQVRADQSRVFARNRLVVIRPRGSGRVKNLSDLGQAGRIAIGNPDSVPAGRYGREMLEHLKLWEPLRPRLVFAENVQQVLDYVARDEVDAGLVYATDASVGAARVEVVAEAPPDGTSPIAYPLAVIAVSGHPESAGRFVDLVLSAEGQALLGAHGFLPAGGP